MVSAPAAFLRHLAALPGWQGPGGRRSYSWVDQRLRAGQFVHPDGTPVRPLRTPGGYRRFTLAIRRMRTHNRWFHSPRSETCCATREELQAQVNDKSNRLQVGAQFSRFWVLACIWVPAVLPQIG
jgi:hypothetical protein